MATYFISDLHLSNEQPRLRELFCRFLRQQAQNADALYILGDLFEFWVGDDCQDACSQAVITELRQYAQQVAPVYLMPGNRDFLLGNQFCQQAGCSLLAEPSILNIYGELMLVLHGDSLCGNDKRHQYFRQFSRSSLIRRLFLRLPSAGRHRLADKVRRMSQRRMALLDEMLTDTTPACIEKLTSNYDFNAIIHGHTHRPSIEYQLQRYARFVLSDWGPLGNALVCYPSGQKRLVYFE